MKDKKCMRLIYGQSIGRVAGLIIYSIILSILILGVGIFALSELLKGILDSVVVFSVLFVCLLAEDAWLLYLVAKSFKHSAKLKEKYRKLSQSEQEEIYALTEEYDSRWGMCFNDTYIYGNMTRIKRGSKKFRNVVGFEYFKLTELAWIYIIETQAAVDVSGTMVRMNLPKEYCFYLYDGECYKAKSDELEIQDLFSLLAEKNPACRLGYSKEWEAEFRAKFGL